MPLLDTIARLRDRLGPQGFGRITFPPAQPFAGPRGVVQVPPSADEKQDIAKLLARLERDHGFVYDRDELELTYERGTLTLARLTFIA